MLDPSLVTAVAYYVAWSHLTSRYTLQKTFRHFCKAFSGFWRQVPARGHIPKFFLEVTVFTGLGSGLSTIDLIQTHTSILYHFPQFLSPAEDNTSLFPLIQASCVFKIIVDSCFPLSPCSDCCQITPSAHYTQNQG